MKVSPHSDESTNWISKVAPVTALFWVIKICATTVGETGGDALSMTLQLGYAVSSLIFLGLFVATLVAQIKSNRYHPILYWAVVVATTTVGTTMSDYLDRTLGLGYIKSSILLFCGVLAILAAWRLVMGKVRFDNVSSKPDELFYWVTILVSNTLGTALGDFVATDTGLGFERSAILFAALLGVLLACHFFTDIPKSVLFWSAYVLTRPLGATLGDTLTKPRAEAGFELGRITSSLVIAAVMIAIIVAASRRSNQMAQSYASASD